MYFTIVAENDISDAEIEKSLKKLCAILDHENR